MIQIGSQKITPCLWYDNQAREAAEFYCSIFGNSRILSSSEITVEFELEEIKFIALNGGPEFKFTEATSFFVLCEDQNEVDHFWDKLTSDGGEESQCGWLKDKFGLSWQIVPKRFMEMMQSGDNEKIQRVMQVMMPMQKMIVEDFEKAFNS